MVTATPPLFVDLSNPLTMNRIISQEHYELIKVDEAKFILEHGEKELKELSDTSKDIVTRTTSVMTIAIAIIVALIGFAISRWDKNQRWDELVVAAAVGAFYLFVSGTFILYNLTPKNYYGTGAEPKDLFIDKIFNKDNESYRMIAIYVNEIIECQKRIKENKITNDKKWARYRRALWMLYFVPVVLSAAYFIAYPFFQGAHCSRPY